MANYKILISASAEKALKKMPAKDVGRIVSAVQDLAREPRPLGCKKLAGEELAYRIRIGSYRVIYEIHDKILLVTVLKIGHRKQVYR